jgi:serine/threonine protein phosphatase 1
MHPNAFQKLLDRAGFSDEDFLFILGDVIDRGEYGAQFLLWLTQQPNMELILGNHEALLLACEFLFEEATDDSLDRLTPEKIMLMDNWLENGGLPTIRGFGRMLKEQPELVDGILDYLRDSPLYEELEVSGRKFVLVHGGLENFRPERPLSDYAPGELLLARPNLDTRYFSDATVIFGHTPTQFFGEAHHRRAVKTDSWICIDTDVGAGYLPMLLRLDDMKEFY